jgi:hypothetical protein
VSAEAEDNVLRQKKCSSTLFRSLSASSLVLSTRLCLLKSHRSPEHGLLGHNIVIKMIIGEQECDPHVISKPQFQCIVVF